MPPIRLLEKHTSAPRWQGQCPRMGCGTSFEVVADPWQSKISVLASLRPALQAPSIQTPSRGWHVHGRFIVTEPYERGGE